MRHFSRILFLLGATFSSVALSHAQTPPPAPTLTITDQLASGSPADHGAIQHWQQFSTTLSANVSDAPQPDAETTISGPTYQWTGGDSVVVLTATQNQTTGLQSSSKPGTELPPGQHSPTVTCTATYTRTDNKDATKTSAIPVSGSLTVKFWSTKPVSLKSLDKDPIYGTEFFHVFATNGNFYHGAIYNFAVIDNQLSAQHYGAGKLHEKFTAPSTLNPDYADSLSTRGAPGAETTTPSATDTFGDNNSWNTETWPTNEVAKTSNAGPTDFWYSFPQTWQCLEQAIGDPDYIRSIDLTPTFKVTHRRDYVERH